MDKSARIRQRPRERKKCHKIRNVYSKPYGYFCGMFPNMTTKTKATNKTKEWKNSFVLIHV